MFGYFVVGKVFEVVFHGVFQQPGKRVKPLQQEHDFGKKNVERVFFADMNVFVADNHFQIGVRKCFFGNHNFAEKRKRMHIFWGDIHQVVKNFLNTAFLNDVDGFEVAQQKMKQESGSSEQVQSKQIMVPFENKCGLYNFSGSRR